MEVEFFARFPVTMVQNVQFWIMAVEVSDNTLE